MKIYGKQTVYRDKGYEMKRRIGKFYVTRDLIVRDQEEIAEMFSQLRFIPVRVEMLFHINSLEYIGFSYLFKEIEEGLDTPEYNIITTQDDEGILNVEVKELK